MQESEELTRERERRKAERKAFSESVSEARVEVESAIESLEAQPRTFGGHLSKDGTSVIDGSWSDATLILFDGGWRRRDTLMKGREVIHRDGRSLTFDSMIEEGTPYPTAICVTEEDRWIVVPAHKLRSAAA